MRFAVLDLGSTTFQLLVAEADLNGSLTPVIRDRVVLNLGAALADRGRIPRRLARRAAETVLRFRTVAERAACDRLIAVATSALRDAPNRDELIALLEPAAGQEVRFIDGREEARLMFAGIRASVALGPGPTLFLDLGGGSLEVAVADGELRWGESLPLGAGRLTAELVREDPPSRADRRRVRRRVEDLLTPLIETVGEAGAVRCVASGGTAGALARLLAAERWVSPPVSLNGFELDVGEVQALARRLAAVPLRERLRLPGIDDRRANLLPVGGIVLSSAARALGAASLVHSEWGLREGIVLDELGLASGHGPTRDELRRRSVDRLIRAWSEDPGHIELMTGLSLRLFDDLTQIHGLGDTERGWLRCAAQLHDIGVRVSPNHANKHSAYLVENGGLRGFSPEDVAAIASLVRFQVGRRPRDVYGPFAGLSRDHRHAVRVLAGLLRVAHALVRGGRADVVELSVHAGERDVVVRLAGTSNPKGAAAEAHLQAELLERVLGIRVRFEATLLDTPIPPRSSSRSA